MWLKRKYFLLCMMLIYTLFLWGGCREKITTPDKTPRALQIITPSYSIYSGGTLQLSAIVIFEDETTSDITTSAIWSNQPGQAGSVSAEGLFTAMNYATGMETVRADYQGMTASVDIEITTAAISLSIWPMKVTIESGKNIQFEAVAEFQDVSREYVTNKVDWSVSPGLAGTIDSTGFFRSRQGITGEEIVTAKLHALTTESYVQLQTTIENLFEMVRIPDGSFIMGDDQGWANEKPAHQVFTNAYEISKYEVTNAQYVAYLNEALSTGQIIVSFGLVSGKKGPFATMIYFMYYGNQDFPDEYIEYVETEPGTYQFQVIPGFEQYPVVRLHWYGAVAFCNYYGLRLPTEAEWERACRGGQQLNYGTQDGSISHNLANYLGVRGSDIYEGLAPVGSFPQNPFGIYDMSGNAAEFVFDVYDAKYYETSPAENPTGSGPDILIGRLPNEIALWRGGSWISYPFYCRSVYRGTIEDMAELNYLSNSFIGFRVARSLY